VPEVARADEVVERDGVAASRIGRPAVAPRTADTSTSSARVHAT
jgi:hypothetical protein